MSKTDERGELSNLIEDHKRSAIELMEVRARLGGNFFRSDEYIEKSKIEQAARMALLTWTANSRSEALARLAHVMAITAITEFPFDQLSLDLIQNLGDAEF
jgi:hypothetical protein